MSVFHFKNFDIIQDHSAMKVGTDSMIFGSFLKIQHLKNALDIGSGTGVLSLMCAQQNPEIKITAVEIDSDTSKEALLNVKNSSFNNQIEIINADFLEHSFNLKFDLIFCNPPFFENSRLSEYEIKNLARHTNSLPFDELFKKACQLLHEKGIFKLILPSEHKLRIEQLALQNKLYISELIEIYAKKDVLKRHIYTFSFNKKKTVRTKFIIRNEDNSYSEQYKKTTFKFHKTIL